jgi:hypothetical protein
LTKDTKDKEEVATSGPSTPPQAAAPMPARFGNEESATQRCDLGSTGDAVIAARLERIATADVQALRIGHFGSFRDRFQSSLWPRTVALLQGFQPIQETAA